MQTIKRFLTPPVFPNDEDKTHQAFILHVIVWGLILVPVPYVFYTMLATPASTSRALVQAGFGEAVNLFLLFLLRRGHVRLASVIQITTFWFLFTLIAFTGGGVRGQGYLAGYGLVIVIAGVLLGGWGAVVVTIASLASGGVMLVAENNGWLGSPTLDTALGYWIVSLALFPPAALVQNLAARTVRRALARARASEAEYRSLIQESPEGIIIVDTQKRIALANPAVVEILGYPTEELIGTSPFELFDPEDLARQPIQIDTMKIGEILRQERTFIHKNGSHISVMSGVKRMPDGRYQIIFLDISERKRLEQVATRRALELSALYQAYVDLSAQPDVPTLLQTIVERAVKLMDLQIGSLYLARMDNTLELSVAYNLPQQYIGVRLQMGEGLAGRAVQSGNPMMIENYQTWENRATVFDHLPSRRVLSVPLKVRNRIIGAMNVTDTQQTGPFSREEVRLLTLFADQAAIAIENAQLYEQTQIRAEQLATMNEIGRAVSTLQDLESVLELVYHQVMRIVPVDAFFISLHDSDKGLVSFPIMYDLGTRYEEPTIPLKPDTWIAQVILTHQPFMLHRSAKEIEEPLERGLGNMKRKSASILIVPLWFGSRVIGVLSVQSYTLNAYTDEHAKILTGIGHQVAIAIENAKLFTEAQQELQERRRVEIERESLIKELETKNAELERFTYTVSHDLKSPLITMRGFLGYLEQDARSNNTERLRSDISRIIRATDKMEQLLNELLELSRIGRLMNPPEAWPFESIAHEAVSLVEGRIAQRGVQVSIQFGMPTVYGDHVRLVEVVQNLVDNACKFMGDQANPQIEIGTRGSDKDKPIFFVRDNGIGIAPQYQDRVFGLFNKLDPKTEGTGIGLALVKRIVEVHGGRIWVESEGIGKGSTFCFTLNTKE